MLNKTTLLAYQNDQLIFSSEKNWLYPLIDLSAFLKRQKITDAKLMVEDKVVGRAWASSSAVCNNGSAAPSVSALMLRL